VLPHRAALRLAHDCARSIRGCDPAVFEDHPVVGDPGCIVEVMGDEENGGAELLVHVGDHGLQVAADGRVDAGERFVGEQNAGPHSEGACERDALLFAS